jgi:choline dehydrogenase
VEATRTNWLTLVNHQVRYALFSQPSLLKGGRTTQTSRLVFDNSSSFPVTANAIEFMPTPRANVTSSNQTFTAFSRREIILAAGSIRTPQLLQLSGIGDKDHLASFGIDSIVDLPTVGKNLQEQPNSPFGAFGNGFNKDGLGPNDVIALYNIRELFGEQADDAIEEIRNGIDSWAQSQSLNAASVEALKTIFEIQAKTITDDNGTL